MKRFLIAGLMMACISTPSIAADLPAGSNAPVEISAKKTLEWNRKDKTYIAREDAIAKQGTFEVHSETLTARYEDGNGTTDIKTLEADTHVTILSPPYTARGEHAVYTVATGNAVLTGGTLEISTPTDKLTAKDKIAFYGTENRLDAIGKATATRGTDKLDADLLTAYFAQGADGQMTLQKIVATGNVVITTAKEKVYGDKGVYDIPAQQADLTGNVKVYQGENMLEGTRAKVDLTTGISKLFADDNPSTEGRVKGIFYPKKSQP